MDDKQLKMHKKFFKLLKEKTNPYYGGYRSVAENFDEKVKEKIDYINENSHNFSHQDWENILEFAILHDDNDIIFRKMFTTQISVPDDILISAISNCNSLYIVPLLLFEKRSPEVLDSFVENSSALTGLKNSLLNSSSNSHTTKWLKEELPEPIDITMEVVSQLTSTPRLSKDKIYYNEDNINYIAEKILNRNDIRNCDILSFVKDFDVVKKWFDNPSADSNVVYEEKCNALINNENLPEDFRDSLIDIVNHSEISFPTPQMALKVYDLRLQTIDSANIEDKFISNLIKDLDYTISNWLINNKLPVALQKDYVLRAINEIPEKKKFYNNVNKIFLKTNHNDVFELSDLFPIKIRENIYYNDNVPYNKAMERYNEIVEELKDDNISIMDKFLNCHSLLTLFEKHLPTIEQSVAFFEADIDDRGDFADKLRIILLTNKNTEKKLLEEMANKINNARCNQTTKICAVLSKLRLEFEEQNIPFEDYNPFIVALKEAATLGPHEEYKLDELIKYFDRENSGMDQKELLIQRRDLILPRVFRDLSLCPTANEIADICSKNAKTPDIIEDDFFVKLLNGVADIIHIDKLQHIDNLENDISKKSYDFLTQVKGNVIYFLIANNQDSLFYMYDNIDKIAPIYVEVCKELSKREREEQKRAKTQIEER